MPNWPASALIAAGLALLSIAPKIWLQGRSAQVDGDRLNSDIATRLDAAGFRVSLDRDLTIAAVRAVRGECRLIARNGDRARELHDMFNLEGRGFAPVAFGYRGHWATHPAGARAVFERFAQNGLARVGVDVSRPAVIAIATDGPCPGAREALDGVSAHAYLKRQASVR